MRVSIPGSGYKDWFANSALQTLLVTGWESFRALDFNRIRILMADPLLVDLRNTHQRAQLALHDFRYASIGRPIRSVDESLSANAQ